MSEVIVVTGAAGFIGSHCSRALLERGCVVRGVDNFDPFYGRELKDAGVAELSGFANFELITQDIRDRLAMERVLRGADVVVHLAARAGVRPSIEDPELYTSINVGGTVAVLEACRRQGVRRFVFGSSSSVYGNAPEVPFSEDLPCVDPISPYAATKRAGELLCSAHGYLYGLRVAALRFFTVYGARQRPDLAIHKFTRLIRGGSPIQRFGDGSTERDYTHVRDIVQGVLGAVDWTAKDETGFEIFNLGESTTVSLSRLIELIARQLGTEPRVEPLPEQPGDVRRTYAEITKAREVLGYRPTVDIESGIGEFVSWFEEFYGGQRISAARAS
ncbi:MAG TPA: NAD-dependent epimerase/dehydratase family protein [Gemmatimonadales bacterium]